jgi:hypothetical protein
MNQHIAANAKAYAALIGGILTAVLGSLTPESHAYKWVALGVAICTSITVWVVPNSGRKSGRANTSEELDPSSTGPQD